LPYGSCRFSDEIEIQHICGDRIESPKSLFVWDSPSVGMNFNASNFSAAELEGVLDRVFGTRLIFDGFERIKPRCWVRDSGKGFKQMFHLPAHRPGAGYVPYGALSIDFVPRVSARKVRLQPDSKHAVVHLSYEPGLRHWDWIISPSREGFTDRIERIAGETVPRITEWLERFTSIGDVVSAIEKKKSKPHDFYCYPLQVLAFAFCLARVGRTEDASQEFEKAISLRYFSEELEPELRSHFESQTRQFKNDG
jgi:hypothetical protein